MRSTQEIQNRIDSLKQSEAELQKRIEEELKGPIKSDSVMARVGFYSSQRKQTAAKIEELNWVLDQLQPPTQRL